MIDLTRTSALAVRDLKHYLEFAQRGPVALGEAVLQVGGSDQFDSEFEESVANNLRDRGWIVHTQIGVSKFRIDLGIVHPDYPGKYLAGVECDGATYHSSPTARDRDQVRHAILENLNWKLIRIWSTDYFLDPGRTLDRVHERLVTLHEEDCAREEEIAAVNTEQDPPPPTETVEDGPHTLNINENDDLEVTPLNLPIDTSETDINILPDRFYDPEYLSVLQTLATKLIDDLGPITFRYLSVKIARLHGFQKTGSKIKKQVWAAISNTRHSTRPPNQEVIFWPKDSTPANTITFRGLDYMNEERSWQDVPYPEKLGLAQTITSDGPYSDAPAVMASKIGLGRLRQTTRLELETLLSEAQELSRDTSI